MSLTTLVDDAVGTLAAPSTLKLNDNVLGVEQLKAMTALIKNRSTEGMTALRPFIQASPYNVGTTLVAMVEKMLSDLYKAFRDAATRVEDTAQTISKLVKAPPAGTYEQAANIIEGVFLIPLETDLDSAANALQMAKTTYEGSRDKLNTDIEDTERKQIFTKEQIDKLKVAHGKISEIDFDDFLELMNYPNAEFSKLTLSDTADSIENLTKEIASLRSGSISKIDQDSFKKTAELFIILWQYMEACIVLASAASDIYPDHKDVKTLGILRSAVIGLAYAEETIMGGPFKHSQANIAPVIDRWKKARDPEKANYDAFLQIAHAHVILLGYAKEEEYPEASKTSPGSIIGSMYSRAQLERAYSIPSERWKNEPFRPKQLAKGISWILGGKEGKEAAGEVGKAAKAKAVELKAWNTRRSANAKAAKNAKNRDKITALALKRANAQAKRTQSEADKRVAQEDKDDHELALQQSKAADQLLQAMLTSPVSPEQHEETLNWMIDQGWRAEGYTGNGPKFATALNAYHDAHPVEYQAYLDNIT